MLVAVVAVAPVVVVVEPMTWRTLAFDWLSVAAEP